VRPQSSDGATSWTPARLRALGLLLLACSALASCLVLDNGNASFGAQDFAARFAAALCDNVRSCCDAAGKGFNQQQCESNVGLGLVSERQTAQHYALRYDPDAAAACVKAVGALTRSCRAFKLDDPRATKCDRVYRGSLSAGATCETDLQCAPVAGARTECRSLSGANGRICTLTDLGLHARCTPAGAGEPETRRCAFGKDLICDPDSRVCESGPAAGQPCVQGRCGAGDFCERTSSVCMPYPGPGSPCLDQSQASMQCAIGAFCDGTMCKQSGGVGGQPCESDDECSTGYCSAYACAPRPLLATDATCGLTAISIGD
jgi:hypothetical protein